MEAQVTGLTRWFEVDGAEGIVWIPFDDVCPSQNTKTFYPYFSELEEFYPFDIWSYRVFDGYGARLSMPGYLDCTGWVVFETEREAIEYLKELQERG